MPANEIKGDRLFVGTYFFPLLHPFLPPGTRHKVTSLCPQETGMRMKTSVMDGGKRSMTALWGCLSRAELLLSRLLVS